MASIVRFSRQRPDCQGVLRMLRKESQEAEQFISPIPAPPTLQPSFKSMGSKYGSRSRDYKRCSGSLKTHVVD
ncbi:hypothetical protein E2C01_023649 [Portunus trituberculatus]|uniref:Uncharacterized protein n=1 Tax=Portunus trituberculatus TaxID=210409 RepID=A0A5B7EB46_PORTR|nr:hypothetical protein [Portunus trituberculatus]